MIFANVLSQAGVRRGPSGCRFVSKSKKSHLPIHYYAYSYSQVTKILISLHDRLGSSAPSYELYN